MIEIISTFFIKNILDFSTSIINNLVTSNVWDKLNQDLETVIFKLIQEQYFVFKNKYPDVVVNLKEKDIHPTISRFFSDLDANKLDKPLKNETLATIFSEFFLQPRYRETGDIPPQFRTALLNCAEDFIRRFKIKVQHVFTRHPATATQILINSLEQSGKNDEEIIALLQQIKDNPENLPTLLSGIVEPQLLPAIKEQTDKDFNRFGENSDFVLRVMRSETTDEEEKEREWIAQLAQVLEWKGFTIINRSTVSEAPGVFFNLEQVDDFGRTEEYLCWGYPLNTRLSRLQMLAAIEIFVSPKYSLSKRFIISKSQLSKDEIESLRKHKITTCLTLDEFVQTLLNISKHRQVIMTDYEKTPIYNHYIELYCHRCGNAKKPFILKDFFYNWLSSKSSTHISLLGDSGTGKTVFCQMIQWELLKSYKPGNAIRIPILITLREQKGLKLPQMIDIIMNNMGLRQIDYTAFRTLNRMGLFIILMDGFDEMAANVTVDEMIQNFRELALLAEGRAKVLLTSRTHYFEHLAREEQVMSLPEFIHPQAEFQTIYLNPFTREQIKAYLDKVKRVSKSKQEVLLEMDRNPILKELIQTPVLLDLFLNIFPEFMKKKEPVSISLFYETSIASMIAKENKKDLLSKLTPGDIIQFIQELAWQMHSEKKMAINYKNLKSQVYKSFSNRMGIDSYELDAFYGEIRTFPFLTRDSIGNYQFVHKSYMDYFAAKKIFENIKNEGIDVLTEYLSHRLLSNEVLQFLIPMNKELIYKALIEAVENRSSDVGKYAFDVLRRFFYTSLNRR